MAALWTPPHRLTIRSAARESLGSLPAAAAQDLTHTDECGSLVPQQMRAERSRALTQMIKPTSQPSVPSRSARSPSVRRLSRR